jgi:restriction system protein
VRESLPRSGWLGTNCGLKLRMAVLVIIPVGKLKMWDYADSARLVTVESIYSSNCIYCRSRMHQFPSMDFHLPSRDKSLLAQVSVCTRCGWWSVFRVHQGEIPRTADLAESYSGSIGALKELDLSDISAPLTEVRGYLLAKPDTVFAAHPRLIEDVVGSIFKSQGWETVVTAYSRDGGIDIFLRDQAGKLIGVQVKRGGVPVLVESRR